MKTDHKGIILPAATELKPVRLKYEFKDLRHHRYLDFNNKVLAFNWDSIFLNYSLDDSVNQMQYTIKSLMDQCFPTKLITMSSRDPPWMTPVLKFLLKKRSTSSRKQAPSDLITLNNRISELIKHNRRCLSSGAIGSGKWWKKVDILSQRKEKSGSGSNL